jgi:hypothetical protein
MTIKQKQEKLIENTRKSFEAFKTAELAKEKSEIFNNAYEIYFYSEVWGYISEGMGTGEDCSLESEVVTSLLSLGDGILESLYYLYIKWEYASVNSYDEIYNFLTEAARHFN